MGTYILDLRILLYKQLVPFRPGTICFSPATRPCPDKHTKNFRRILVFDFETIMASARDADAEAAQAKEDTLFESATTWHVDPDRGVWIYAVDKKEALAKIGTGETTVPLVQVSTSTGLRPTLPKGIQDMRLSAEDRKKGVPGTGVEFSNIHGKGVVLLLGNSNSPLYVTEDGTPRDLPSSVQLPQSEEDGIKAYKYTANFTSEQRTALYDLVTKADAKGGAATLRPVKNVSVVFVDGGHRGKVVQKFNDELILTSPTPGADEEWKFSRGAYTLLLPPIEAVKAIELASGKGHKTLHETILQHFREQLNGMAARLNRVASMSVPATAKSALLSAVGSLTARWNLKFDDKGVYQLAFEAPSSWTADCPDLLTEFQNASVFPIIVDRRRQSIDNPLRKKEVFQNIDYPRVDKTGMSFGKIFKGVVYGWETGQPKHCCATCNLPGLMQGAAETPGLRFLLQTVPESLCPRDSPWKVRGRDDQPSFLDELAVPVGALSVIAAAATNTAKIAAGWDAIVAHGSTQIPKRHDKKEVLSGDGRTLRVAAIQSSFHSGIDNCSQSLLLYMVACILEDIAFADLPDTLPFHREDDDDRVLSVMRHLVFRGLGLQGPVWNATRCYQKLGKVVEGSIVVGGVRLYVLHALSGALGFHSPGMLLEGYCTSKRLRDVDGVEEGEEEIGRWALRRLRLSFHKNPGLCHQDEIPRWTLGHHVPTSSFDMSFNHEGANAILVKALRTDGCVAVLHAARKSLSDLAQAVLTGDHDKAIAAAYKTVMERTGNATLLPTDWKTEKEPLKNIMPVFLIASGGTCPDESQTTHGSLHGQLVDTLTSAWTSVHENTAEDVAKRHVVEGLSA